MHHLDAVRNAQGGWGTLKEDVLEQVVEDYLQLRGYFTLHNLRFKPAKTDPGYVVQKDSVPSDVDVVGLNPLLTGQSRVHVISCKAWQSGFDAGAKLAQMRGERKQPQRQTWQHFRELWSPKWADAFHRAVFDATGESTFTYSIAVTRLTGATVGSEADTLWCSDPTIQTNLRGCSFSFVTMRHMWDELQSKLTTTPAPSEIGRLAQLLRAADVAT